MVAPRRKWVKSPVLLGVQGEDSREVQYSSQLAAAAKLIATNQANENTTIYMAAPSRLLILKCKTGF
jgi:uncharacterized lipoprotein NlpE involved in copper resistance